MTFLFSHIVSSQELFFKVGRNFTNYDYSNAKGQKLSNLKGSSGTNYEFGVEFFLDRFNNGLESMFSYSLSINLNQFNSKGGNVNNTYEWNTNYFGIQNMAYASLLTSYEGYYCLKFKVGVNTSTIMSGQQYINNYEYDLTKYDEFKGIFVQPIIGADFRLDINREVSLNIGYTLSKAFNISNKSSENLSFANKQFQLGFQYTF